MLVLLGQTKGKGSYILSNMLKIVLWRACMLRGLKILIFISSVLFLNAAHAMNDWISSSEISSEDDYVNSSFFDDDRKKDSPPQHQSYRFVNKTGYELACFFFIPTDYPSSFWKRFEPNQKLQVIADQIIELIKSKKIINFMSAKKGEHLVISSQMRQTIHDCNLGAYLFVIGNQDTCLQQELACWENREALENNVNLKNNANLAVHAELMRRMFFLDKNFLLNILDKQEVMSLHVEIISLSSKTLNLLTYGDSWVRPTPGHHYDLVIYHKEGWERVRNPFPSA